MPLRLVQVSVPEDGETRVLDTIRSDSVVGSWSHALADDRLLVSILADAKDCEGILDRLGQQFPEEGFRAVILPVEATLPKPPPEEPKSEAKPDRIGRDELLQDLAEGLHPGPRFFVTVLLSSVVAAIGLLRNDLAIIIGAMVIAPLLTPNVALALGTTLGDLQMVRRAFSSNLYGVLLAVGFSLLVGRLVGVDPGVAAIESRTVVTLGDFGLALAAGTAGALAFTSGLPSSLVGVMVAVALLPPTVVTGLLLGAGRSDEAMGSLLLLATNVTCLNLSAIVTFWIQGLRPRTWWDAEKASRALRIAILLWSFLVVVLATLIAIGAS
jgi:uncharacterized hydrophobic protein (TIGR00341 family)